jgi:hypothetical protein
MLVTATVFTYLALVGILAITFFVAGDLGLAGAYKSNTWFDRLLRKIPTEQYLQLVVLPLCGAIAGGLISTALPIFLDHPWWKPDSRTYIGYALIIIGLIVIVAGPLTVHILYANPKNLTIALRIERLKNGDWTGDSQADIIKTINDERIAITEKRDASNLWFLASIVLMFVSGAVWLVFVYIAFGIRSGVIMTLLIVALILFGIWARYRLRPKSLQSALADLDSYETETNKLSPPALTAPPSRATAVPRRYNQRDLTMAVGGLLIGAILARLGALLSRDVQRR